MIIRLVFLLDWGAKKFVVGGSYITSSQIPVIRELLVYTGVPRIPCVIVWAIVVIG